MTAPPPFNPFAVLGLAATPMVTDAEVREAWRAAAAATHPDRPDGGNPAAYAAASAAFGMLRGPWSRTEAYADLIAAGAIPAALPGPAPEPPAPVPAVPAVPVPVPPPALARPPGIRALPARLRHGRPAALAARVAAAALAGTAAWFSGAGLPATAGMIMLAVTWLAVTGRRDLAPPPGR